MASAWYPADVTSGLHERAEAVLDYWIGPGYNTGDATWAPGPDKQRLWFGGGPAVDQEVRTQFLADIEAAAAGRYDDWLGNPLNALAGVILLDQFTRNAYRGSAQAFAADPKAIQWAQTMVANGTHLRLHPSTRQFVYLPYMHQEDLKLQEACVSLFKEEMARCAADGLAAISEAQAVYVPFAEKHRDVVAQWGRFPHRNEVLARESTSEELAGMAAGSIAKFG